MDRAFRDGTDEECYQVAKLELEQIKQMIGKYSKDGSTKILHMHSAAVRCLRDSGNLIVPKDVLLSLLIEAEDIWNVVFGKLNPYYCECFLQFSELLTRLLDNQLAFRF